MPESEGRRSGNGRKRGVVVWWHRRATRYSRPEEEGEGEGEGGSDRARRRAGEEGEGEGDARTVRAEIFSCRPNGVDYSDEETGYYFFLALGEGVRRKMEDETPCFGPCLDLSVIVLQIFSSRHRQSFLAISRGAGQHARLLMAGRDQGRIF